MKLFILIFLVALSSASYAETCTANLKDRYGITIQSFFESSYSRESACSEAMYQCNRLLSDANSSGRYYDHRCELESTYDPNPYPNPWPTENFICQTDLIDQYNRILRSFTGRGRTEWDACGQSDSFCRDELYRNTSWGLRCVTRRNPNPNPGPNPRPPRTKTEQCEARRFDPAGMFIQSYLAWATGPIHTDVRREACERAMSECHRDLKGRQFCNF
jgi:hypothetical protein